MRSGTHRAAPAGGTLGRQAVLTYGTTIVFAVVSLGNALVIARTLGPDGRGAVSLLLSIAGLTALLLCVGVQESNANAGSRTPEVRGTLAVNSLLLAGAFGTIGVAGVLVLRSWLPGVTGDTNVVAVLVAVAGIPLVILMYYLTMLVRAASATTVANVAYLVPPVFCISANGVLSFTGGLSVVTVLVSWLMAQAASDALLLTYIHQRDGLGRPDLALAGASVAFGLRSHVGVVMVAATYRLDQWMLGVLAGTSALGQYAVAVSWAETMFYLPTALALVFRPHFVRGTPGEVAVQAAAVFRMASIVTVPIAAGAILAAPVLCTKIFGAEFEPAVHLLRIIVLGGFGIVALKVLGNALIAQDRPLLESSAVAVAFVLTVALNLVLIPAYGAVGAAWASSLAYLAGGLATCVLFARAFRIPVYALVPRPSDVTQLLAASRERLHRRQKESSR